MQLTERMRKRELKPFDETIFEQCRNTSVSTCITGLRWDEIGHHKKFDMEEGVKNYDLGE